MTFLILCCVAAACMAVAMSAAGVIQFISSVHVWTHYYTLSNIQLHVITSVLQVCFQFIQGH